MFDDEAKINEKVDIYAFGMVLYEIINKFNSFCWIKSSIKL